MKTIIKISMLALLLCIGFIPNATAGSFEPTKTIVSLGDNNPGNYSLLEYGIKHCQNAQRISHVQDSCATGYVEGGSFLQNYDMVIVGNIMRMGQDYQVPFKLICVICSDTQTEEVM